jgi:4a-hydroxytetrahydrobiopterin dehydratase
MSSSVSGSGAQKKLSRESCEACRADAPKLSAAEISALLGELTSWQVLEEAGQKRLYKKFALANFEQALRLADSIGAFADDVDHHPRLVVEWGSLAVTWWTHKIDGLHRNDFICAARSDELAEALVSK